jgi:hypothetical protein
VDRRADVALDDGGADAPVPQEDAGGQPDEAAADDQDGNIFGQGIRSAR